MQARPPPDKSGSMGFCKPVTANENIFIPNSRKPVNPISTLSADPFSAPAVLRSKRSSNRRRAFAHELINCMNQKKKFDPAAFGFAFTTEQIERRAAAINPGTFPPHSN